MKNSKQIKTVILGAACALTLVAVVPVSLGQDKAAPNIKPYPLKTCLVSGEKLDGMGTPYTFTNGNREIKLCCKGCLKDFQKTPAKYIKKLETAEKANANKTAQPAESAHSQH